MSKYSTGRSARWRWEYEHGNPHLTDHALERWDDRTPPGSVAPETAWDHAKKIRHLDMNLFRDKRGREADYVMYYTGVTDYGMRYGALFLVRDKTIITILTPGVGKLASPPVSAYLDAMRANQKPARSERGGDYA